MPAAAQLDRALRHAAGLAGRWPSMTLDDVRGLEHKIIARVVLTPDRITVEIGTAGLGHTLGINVATPLSTSARIG